MSRKAIVLDANILIRAVLGQKVRHLILKHAEEVDFFAPRLCFEDAEKYLPPLLSKRKIPVEPALEVLHALSHVVQIVDTAWLASFEAAAKRRLKRDENDWPILAASFALNCPIWTEDADFFGVGVATWTTATVREYFEG